MAIANSDGSIILSTKVDASGLNKGMSQMEGKTSGLTKAFSKLGAAITAAFAVQKLVQFGQEAINLASDLQEVQNVVDTAFGSMAYKIEDFSKTAIERFGLSELAAKQWASTMMAMGSGMGQSMEIGSDMAVELTGRLADVMSFYNKTEEEAFTLGKAIYSGETEPLKSIGIIMTENNLSLFAMSKGYQQAYKDMDAANKLLVRQQFFLEQTSLAAGDYTKTADGWANQTRTLSQRWKEMQATFGETFITLGVLVLPVIEAIIEGLNQIALMAKAAALSFGLFKEETKTTDKNAENLTKESDKTAENIKKQANNQKNLNKEMKKTLAGFDDIQILSANTAGNTSETLDIGLQGLGGDLGGTPPNGSAYVEEINGTLAAIMQTVAEAMIAVGLILLFTGNIGWGVGAIVFGLVLEGIAVGALTSADPTSAIITSLLFLQGIAIGASVALGIMMIYMGSKGLGIGLIAYGALQLGVTIYEITQFSTKPVETIINTIQGVAAGAMLALGFFLLYFKVNMPLAISLIAGGALLVVDEIFDIVAGGVSPEISAWINRIMLILEGAALVIGVILLMSKVNIPLGISLVATGAFALGKEVAVNWDHIVNALRGPIGKITALVSASLLAIGILVCFVNLPLGIALIAAGAVGLVTVTALNWNSIVDWVKGAWNAVKEFWNKSIAPVFTAKWWKDLAIKCGNGLIAGFEGAINGIIWAFESMINWVVDGLNQISINIPDWVPGIGGQKWGVNIPRATLGRVSIPRLAQGAVIPPNREFLAILGDQKQGTNIETPLATMVEAFQMALDSRVGYSGGNTEVILEIDGREFGRAVVEQGDRENRRIGTRLVVV